jgi:ATP-binding cassette subfamily F protein 1
MEGSEFSGNRAVTSDEIALGTASLEEVKIMIKPKQYAVQFDFPETQPLSPPYIDLKNISFRYKKHYPILFHQLRFGIDGSSRVCIVGNNGSGKSTLLKIMTGELRATRGEVYINNRLRIGVYNQHFMDILPMNSSPVDYLLSVYDEYNNEGSSDSSGPVDKYQLVRNLLGRFGLEGNAHTLQIKDLSGGQKARVVFSAISLSSPQLMIMDEPTNNLDIESIDALCDAIKIYNGGVVLISHDPRLIEETNCDLYVVNKLNLFRYSGSFSSYKQELLRSLEEYQNYQNMSKKLSSSKRRKKTKAGK